jgi:peptidoglycan/LPS O-acetylase OafA/YrhL
LRGLAVVLVVVFHAGLPVPGGFTGVDVFFAISGFVITAMLLSDLTSFGRIGLRRFYARRVKRLAPALALMVVTIASLGTLASPVGGQDVGARTGVFASVFSANIYLFRIPTGYFDPVASLNPFLHLWTLAVEEQFYVFFPTLLLTSWWLGRRSRFVRASGRRAAIVAVSVATGISFLLALDLSGSLNNRHQQFAFYGSPTRAWEFGAGALLALLVPWLARMPQPVAQALGALGLAAIGAGAFAIQDAGGFQVVPTLLPVLGTCALLAAGSASRSGMSRLLSVRPAVWIGDLSYSWYLWHWPLIVFSAALWPGAGWAAPTLAALSLLPAWLSYRYVENPIRFSRRISGRAVLAIAAVCIAVPIGACLGLWEASKVLAATPPMKAYQRSQTPHYAQFGCDTTPLACGRRVPKRRLVLIGDSDAGQFGEPVLRAANRAGFEVTLISSGGCPFVDLRVMRRNRPLPRQGMDLCRLFYLRGLEAIVRMRPNLVITAARTDRYVDTPPFGLGKPGGGAITYVADAKEHLWSEGLASTLRRLNDAGIPVVVVHPVPVVQPISISDCAVIRILTESCMSSVARSAVDRYLRPSVDAEDRAVAAAPAASAIDFRNQLCGRDRCASMRGSTVVYLDRYHLSVDGALALTNEFYRAILAYSRP